MDFRLSPNAPDVKMLRRWLRAAGCSDGLFQSEVMHGSSENFVDAERCRIHNSLAEETNSGLPQLLRRDTDGARNASAAEAAIALRISREILLVIGFGVIKIRPIEDLRCDCRKAPRGQRFGEDRFARLGSGALGRIFNIDGGAILRANIVALPHPLGRIMILPKGL
jgi:hypothetical protein